MKKILLTFCLIFFALPAFAIDKEDDINQGVIQSIIVEEDAMEKEKKPASRFSTKVVFETRFHDNYKAADDYNEYNDTIARARIYNNFRITDELSLNTRVTIRPFDNQNEVARRQNSPNGGGDRSFENVGVVLREFNLVWDRKKYVLVAGKFNLNFGKAWMWNRGIWIHELANNYRQFEKLGFSGIYRLGNAKTTGQYNFNFSAFTNDSKNFDNTLFVNRDSSHKFDGTPGDTRGMSSYNASLDVNFDFGELEKLTYHFSYLNLAVNERATPVAQGKIDDQKSYVLNMNYIYPLPNKMLLDGVLEFMESKNLGGDSDFSERYLSANLITHLDKNWNVLVGTTRHQYLQRGFNGYDENLSEVSIGYEFGKTKFFENLTLQAGYKNYRINHQGVSVDERDAIGVLLRYYQDF